MNAVNGFYRENGREEVGTEHETYAASEGDNIFLVYVDLARELQYSTYFGDVDRHQNGCINDHA